MFSTPLFHISPYALDSIVKENLLMLKTFLELQYQIMTLMNNEFLTSISNNVYIDKLEDIVNK